MKNKLAVELAQDVLKQIAAKKYLATQSTYLTVNDDFFDNELPFKESFAKGTLKCNVCALGSVFTSWININNEYSINEAVSVSANIMREELSEAFSLKELQLMECVFEGWNRMERIDEQIECHSIEYADLSGIEEYHGLFDNPTERLEAMMEHIIESEGVFELL